ncbi:MAG: response regulator [Alphaproteobacteria bacterium]|nr:response regulator [Alphaproteobacteria bacterium]
MEEYNKILDKFVGQKIRERRKALGLTQAELADLLGLSHQQVQRYESGENTISMACVLTIARALNVKPEHFYENAPPSQEDERKNHDGIILRDTERAIRVLLVEDDYSEELLFRKAAEKSSVASEIRAIQNPESVMDYLVNTKAAEKPDLVIMDINMPHLNGIELLKKIRENDKLRNMPVIMLTNSVRTKDMLESYESFANGFVQKNSDLLKFFEDVDLILKYWSKTVILPSIA